MKLQAILSRKTNDEVKSKLKSTELVELVLDVYMTPEQFAELMRKYFDKDFFIDITTS